MFLFINTMYISNAEPGDVPVLLEKIAKIHRQLYEPNMLLHMIAAWPEGCLVMRYGSDITGFLIGVKDRLKSVRIISIGMEESYRGQGHGKRMMKKFFTQCIIEQIRLIHLEVAVDNLRANRFYSDLGFTNERRLACFYEDGKDAYSLVKYI